MALLLDHRLQLASDVGAEVESEAVAECTAAELEIVEELPETITNVKLQTKAYNFLIDSTKFEEVFDFDFKETPTTIVKSIVEQFDNMNKGNRSDAKLY